MAQTLWLVKKKKCFVGGFCFGQRVKKLIKETLEMQDFENFDEYQSNLDPAIIILQVDRCITFCSRNRSKHIM